MPSKISTSLACGPDDSLHHGFATTLISAFPAADHQISEYDLEFIPKIKLDVNRGPPAGAALDLVHEQYDCWEPSNGNLFGNIYSWGNDTLKVNIFVWGITEAIY